MRTDTIAQIAAAIRARRAELGLTKSALADAAGVSRLWVARIESGAPGAELGRLLRVLGALGLAMDISPAGAPPEPVADAGTVDLDAVISEYLDDAP